MQRPILRQLLTFSLLGSALFLTGCASIINGSTQKVKITSQPPGASVRVDQSARGYTPTVVELSRESSHYVEVTRKGYEPYEVELKPSFNGMILGNAIFGGLVGVIIDSTSGASKTLHPKKVDAILRKGRDGGARREILDY